jgi:hypothetical protein
MTKTVILSGVGALAVLAALGATGLFYAGGGSSARGSATAESSEGIVFRCGPMARLQGTEADNCDDAARPAGPGSVSVTPVRNADGGAVVSTVSLETVSLEETASLE